MSDDEIRSLLLTTRRIAMVGASDRPGRPSHGVFRFLLDRGYDVVPVNPALSGRAVHGIRSVATLAEETVAALDRASREHIPVRLLFDDHSLLLDLVTLERKQPQSVRIIGQLIVAAAGKPPREETR